MLDSSALMCPVYEAAASTSRIPAFVAQEVFVADFKRSCVTRSQDAWQTPDSGIGKRVFPDPVAARPRPPSLLRDMIPSERLILGINVAVVLWLGQRPALRLVHPIPLRLLRSYSTDPGLSTFRQFDHDRPGCAFFQPSRRIAQSAD
jgi:hypothetical protein